MDSSLQAFPYMPVLQPPDQSGGLLLDLLQYVNIFRVLWSLPTTPKPTCADAMLIFSVHSIFSTYDAKENMISLEGKLEQ